MMMKKLQAALGVCSLLALTPVTALAQSASPYYMVWDDYSQGFTTGPGAKWDYSPSSGPFIGNDGITTTSPYGGMRVVPKGINPQTGKPAFTLTTGQESAPDYIYGLLDHVKWLVYMNHTASTGYPGFDAVPGQELACETWIGGRTYGTTAHPFPGNAINDAEDDLRLASFAQNTVDAETGMVFDFFFSNKQVYAFYERLPFARTPENRYAAFSFAIPVASRNPDSVHNVKIAYNRTTGVVRWVLDGREVFRVNRLGRLIDRKYLSIDHGGVEQDVEMRQLNCGMGMFTLLDGYLPSKVGLVRVSSAPNNNFFPPLGEPFPITFVDEQSQLSNRLFGQGAELKSLRYVVSSTAANTSP
ncbi:DUF6081 family protein [Archangium sp.]|uniref:DUF6081 family protein n=1 Tax=Archangium sp. TaxID=1872627 RepID=UPI002D366A1C|nr:DUF6081 family protein [Archangium sp.]HYO53603.1 DUF6081 family protein [Archangium sp.]